MGEQPTMDELRARIGRQGSKYAGDPGTGPKGKTCGSCKHKTSTGHAKRYPKCGLTAYTHGDATTIKTSTPACNLYVPAAPSVPGDPEAR